MIFDSATAVAKTDPELVGDVLVDRACPHPYLFLGCADPRPVKRVSQARLVGRFNEPDLRWFCGAVSRLGMVLVGRIVAVGDIPVGVLGFFDERDSLSSLLWVIDNCSDPISDSFQILDRIPIQSGCVAHVEVTGTDPVLDTIFPLLRRVRPRDRFDQAFEERLIAVPLPILVDERPERLVELCPDVGRENGDLVGMILPRVPREIRRPLHEFYRVVRHDDPIDLRMYSLAILQPNHETVVLAQLDE